jgi:hypothetical protein
MINFETVRIIHDYTYGGKGTRVYEYECDENDTKEELEKQLRKKYYFDEEYPGCSYVESWHKEGNKVFVTFRSWGCD